MHESDAELAGGRRAAPPTRGASRSPSSPTATRPPGSDRRVEFETYAREIYPSWGEWGFSAAPYFQLVATRLYATRLQPED